MKPRANLLKRLKRRPLTGVASDDPAALQAQLAEARAALAQSEEEQQTAVRQEQQQLAQVLHDSICQSLGGIALLAALLEKKMPAKSAAPNAAEIRELNRSVQYAVAELHALVYALRSGEPRGSSESASP